MRKKILFVCHGNICRSPMAEFVMKDLVAKAGRETEFYIESAATSTEEIGNPVYPPARRNLNVIFLFCREINGEKKNFCLVTNPRKKLKYSMFSEAES